MVRKRSKKDGARGGNDRAWRGFVQAMRALGDVNVKVGAVGAARNKRTDDGKLTMPELLAIHEFGIPGRIPERAPLRRTFLEKGREGGALLAQVVRPYFEGARTLRASLDLWGAWAVGAVRATVAAKLPPPNAPSTIKAKKSDTPLIDTGRMLQSLTWDVWIGRARDSLGRFTK